MSFKAEFLTVDLLLNSTCQTKGVDAFSISMIKREKQIRKIFTFLIYQNPNLQKQHKELRYTLEANRNVYFTGFINGIEKMYPVKIRDLIGAEYNNLEISISNATEDRNKIFHGQLTRKGLSTKDLVQAIENIKKWCSLLAESANNEFGYDGFGRISTRVSEKDIYPKYLIKIDSMEEYREFIKRFMSNEKKELTEEEIKKSNQSYYQITKREILRGFQLCLENAKSQFNSALKAKSNNGNIGLSNSLLILSAEECIKGFLLVAISFNIQVPFLIKPIFKRHQAKHIRGKELNDFVRGLSLFLGTFSSKRSEQFKTLIGLGLEAAFGGVSNEADWWDKANDSKNDGLYVEYTNNQFQSPVEIDVRDFETSKVIVGRFISLLDIGAQLLNKQPESMRGRLAQKRGGE